MAYRRTSATSTRGRTAGTRRGAAPRRRRRASIATRARYNRGAAAQSRQIQALARMATRNSRILGAQRTYTDYYLSGQAPPTWTSSTWTTFSVVDPATWRQTLRRNDDADKAQNAFVRSMFFQYTCGLNTLTNAATVTLMLVSIRPNSAGFIPSSAMQVGQDYENLGNYQMPVVNSQLMKVRWSKTFIVQTNGLRGTSVTQSATTPVGDPSDSYVRGSVNVDIRTTFRSPSRFVGGGLDPQAWSDLVDIDLRPMQRMYLICYFQSGDLTNVPLLNWSAKFTAVTSN